MNSFKPPSEGTTNDPGISSFTHHGKALRDNTPIESLWSWPGMLTKQIRRVIMEELGISPPSYPILPMLVTLYKEFSGSPDSDHGSMDRTEGNLEVLKNLLDGARMSPGESRLPP